MPDGFPKEEAFKQLVDFGKRIAPEAQANGITVVIEPLRRQETNIINTAGEGLALVKAVNDPNFELLIDFYHLASEKEDPAIIIEAKDHLRHLHMANPQGRVFPLTWEEFDYAPFFANLREIGYAGRISVEASSKDFPRKGPRRSRCCDGRSARRSSEQRETEGTRERRRLDTKTRSAQRRTERSGHGRVLRRVSCSHAGLGRRGG